MNPLAKVLDTLADRTLVPGYSKIGYELRKRHWQPLPEGALRGKRALVTGANSGLGKATAARLAELGATVHLVVRDLGRGEQAREEIATLLPKAELHVDRCDLSDYDSVRRFAEGFLAAHDTVDILVHNAGALPPKRTENAWGDELALAVHVLGPFLLTGLLLPGLRASEDARVVFVSSGGMYAQKLYDGDPQYREGKYGGTAAYARTKRMQVVLAGMWAEHLAGDGISVHSMHPGWAATPGVTDSLPGFAKLMGPLLRDAEQGADTTVWLAASAEGGRTSGRFWHDRTARPEHYVPWTKESAAQRERLWEFCKDRVQNS
ncbi:SDR family NAD(P)-dependent oxidoreductase [Amycolatopsis sp. H20-H5]|uniref:SDR family NAD(P)-dependent oxidoreductase n=1 Tax=Amycolatopsis sp. H20-H5 TaxID=3046309 RepID=UPI002DBD5460|nr:SDR family NAD(P)-dependent oxidoreductase [Amycolatopsis sp. H20-H5]MEC3977989.1 SDR family NAD(P)-dependent oxidoreductase [Amycolatopsis sp. H20-H5]